MSRINDLLRQLETSNPALAKDLRREVDALSDRRAFGLNFERHQPEAVELPGRKVRRGDKVHVLPARGTNPTKESERLWRVVTIDRSGDSPTATIEAPALKGDQVDTSEVLVADLVVVAEFRDPIYPGLVSTGKVERGGDKPFHTVINAENYHALQTLLFTHRGQVDCVYIDPPYNTGSEGWIYNDKYVAGDDLYKHSKWLAFMERRLVLAKELLKPTGVIIVAVGDDEHHRLRMLMDQTFEPVNYLASLAWQGGLSALAKHGGGGLDHMLVYASSRDSYTELIGQWRTPKEGAEAVLAAASAAWVEAEEDPEKATAIFKSWWKAHRKQFDSSLPVYDRIDSSGRVYFGDNLANGMPRPNLQYDLLHPVTGEPVRRHANGWRHTRDRMLANVEEGRILFGPDHTTTATYKRYLDEFATQVPAPSFYRDRRAATLHLTKILGDQRFPNPKELSVLKRWFKTLTTRDALFLDFFGGSGTTSEVVMQMNDEDGGSRRCLLVTNNEASAVDAKRLRQEGHRPGDPAWDARGVYEYVTKPRIETVVSGVRSDGSAYSEGLAENVEFFTLTYEAPLRVSSNREFAKVTPLLWMRAGSQGRRIDDLDAGWDVADTYGVIADLDHSESFLKAVAEAGDGVQMAFIVTDEDRLFTTLCRDLPDHVEPVRLYEAYLRNFEIESGRGSL